METSDVLVVGGGVAGLSIAAELAPECRVLVAEAEDQPGYHSSARSAARLHFALGDRTARALTLESRSFWEAPPDGFHDGPIASRAAALVFATADETGALDALARQITRFTPVVRLDEAGLAARCPVLRTGPGGAVGGLVDEQALALDTAAYLAALARQVRRHGGKVMTGARLLRAKRSGFGWRATFEDGRTVEAGILVNAAGAWADTVAGRVGARLAGLRPLRRTIMTFEAPGVDVRRLPFTKSVGDFLYFGPEGAHLLASPMDEHLSAPCDSQPEEVDVAVAAARVEAVTHLRVARIAHRWAGLRSFAPDRLPLVGEREGEAGFFWFAGQGGAGFQTAPALARMGAGVVLGRPRPVGGIAPALLSPARLD